VPALHYVHYHPGLPRQVQVYSLELVQQLAQAQLSQQSLPPSQEQCEYDPPHLKLQIYRLTTKLCVVPMMLHVLFVPLLSPYCQVLSVSINSRSLADTGDLVYIFN
jgi:hypothetical protein